MKKLLMILGLLVSVQIVQSAELRPQFRLWKSSDLGINEYASTKISSATIIFHMVTGSPTINNGGDSYFVVNQSTATLFSSFSSTKVFCSLDNATDEIGTPYDVIVTSHAFFSKTGGARVGYLWDWLNNIPDHLETGSPSGLRILRD